MKDGGWGMMTLQLSTWRTPHMVHCCALLCCALLFCDLLCFSVIYSALLCSSVLFRALHCSALLLWCALLSMPPGAPLCSFVLCSAVLS